MEVGKCLERCMNVTKLSISFLTSAELVLWNFYCHIFILCDSKVWGIDIIACCEITMRDIQGKNLLDWKLLWMVLYRYIYKE